MRLRTFALIGLVLSCSVALTICVRGVPAGSKRVEDPVCSLPLADMATYEHPTPRMITRGPTATLIQIGNWARRHWQRLSGEAVEELQCN